VEERNADERFVVPLLP